MLNSDEFVVEQRRSSIDPSDRQRRPRGERSRREPAGALTAIDAKPAIPRDIAVESHFADIQISPDGRFLYGSNRGHDSVVVFETGAATGALNEVIFCMWRKNNPKFGADPIGQIPFLS